MIVVLATLAKHGSFTAFFVNNDLLYIGKIFRSIRHKENAILITSGHAVWRGAISHMASFQTYGTFSPEPD